MLSLDIKFKHEVREHLRFLERDCLEGHVSNIVLPITDDFSILSLATFQTRVKKELTADLRSRHIPISRVIMACTYLAG